MTQTFKQPTPRLKKREQIHWIVVDAAGKTLGRLSSEVAKVLRGKHRPTYTPNVDCGDGVIIINAGQVHLTGAKRAQKVYRHHTGYSSGLREIPYETMLERKPEYILEHAVKGMMPRNRLTRQQLKRLRIFKGETHDMQAQNPISVDA